MSECKHVCIEMFEINDMKEVRHGRGGLSGALLDARSASKVAVWFN